MVGALTRRPSRPHQCGNRITSRIDGLPVSTMTRRSTPMPSPPVGGRPYRARGRSPRPSRAPRGRRLARSSSCCLEAPALLRRIVQLAEGVGHLEAADVQLEALDRVGVVGALLGQRRDLGREVVDEGRLDQLILPQRLEDRSSRSCRRRRRRLDVDAEPRRDAARRLRDRAGPPPSPASPSRRDASSAAAWRSDRRRNGAANEIVCPSNSNSGPCRSPRAPRSTSISSVSAIRSW